MKELEVFSQRVREWRKYLESSTDITNPNWIWATDPPLPLPDDVKSEMMDEDSNLLKEIGRMMFEKGVELTLRWLKGDYFSRGYFFLKSKSFEIDKEEFPDLLKLLSVGDIFLQNCADMAFEMGADPATIKEMTGVCPREAGGMSLTENYIPKPHTQAKAAQPCNPAFLCNDQEPQKEPQGGGKGTGLAVVPNEPQRAAGGQEMGNDRLQYYCNIATEKGYLKRCGDGYKRLTISKAQLAYFLGHFPNVDGSFPDNKYSVMFHESRLGKACSQLMNNKNGDGKPRGYEIIDELLSM